MLTCDKFSQTSEEKFDLLRIAGAFANACGWQVSVSARIALEDVVLARDVDIHGTGHTSGRSGYSDGVGRQYFPVKCGRSPHDLHVIVEIVAQNDDDLTSTEPPFAGREGFNDGCVVNVAT